jgi:hypothetical protein
MQLSIVRYLDKKDSINIVALVLIWIIAVLLANPIGNFPLADDWCYGKNVKHFLEMGEIKLLDWAAPTQLTQILWGALFCLPFGFSFTALRFSTLVLAIFGIIAVYGILREIGARKAYAFFGALLVAMNPIYFLLSNTFMTDVPFLAFASASFYFFIRALKKLSFVNVAAGTFFACAATLTRQNGVAIPISYAVACFIRRKRRSPSIDALGSIATIKQAIPPSIITFGLLIGYTSFLIYMGGFPKSAGKDCIHIRLLIERIYDGPAALSLILLCNILFLFTYLGLFLLPILLIQNTIKNNDSPKKIKNAILLACFLLEIPLVIIVISQRKLMPFADFRGNIIENFGLGPSTLKDVFIQDKHNLPMAPRLLWLVVTIAGLIGGLMLLKILILRFYDFFRRNDEKENGLNRCFAAFALSVVCLFIAPIILLDALFDRYMIVFLMPLIILIIGQREAEQTECRKANKALAALITSIFILFSICGTHDYLAWNKARWQALDYLTKEKGISPHNIDGGFEFNAWHLYDIVDRPQDKRSWWWVDDDEFIISFGDFKKYDPYMKFKYKRWLPPDSARIFIQKRRKDKVNSRGVTVESFIKMSVFLKEGIWRIFAADNQ